MSCAEERRKIGCREYNRITRVFVMNQVVEIWNEIGAWGKVIPRGEIHCTEPKTHRRLLLIGS